MLIYLTILLNIVFCQDYENLNSKNISPLLFNSSMSYNERIANDKSSTILNKRIDINQYIVGPGDEFYISFSANNFSFNNNLVVSPTGDLIIPGIVIMNVDKLTLNDAYKKIVNTKFYEKQISNRHCQFWSKLWS